MQADPAEIKRRQYLLAVLIVLAVIVAGLIFIIASYPYFLAPEPTNTATTTSTKSATMTATTSPTVTPTATITKTPRPTSSLTATLTPSITPSPAPSATLTGVPTLTPALPFGNNLVYSFDGWTPEKADYLIKLMEGYPDTLPESERGVDNSEYYGSFEYAVIALSDALDQFPGSLFAEEWKWDYAFNLARIGASSAGGAYAKLISDGLNNGDTTVQKLKSWFISNEPRLDFSLAQIDPVPGYVNSYIAGIRGGGGALIWLLESEEGFQTRVLDSVFDFENQPSMEWIFSDLNNNPQDGEEIAVFSSNKPGDYALQPPEVFNLSQPLPNRLLFIPDKDLFEVGMDFNNYWSVLNTEINQNMLKFESKVYPVCPVTINRVFLWNGTYFGYISEGYKVEPLPGALFFCEYILDHAENEWGPEAAIQIMETLFPIWPPQVDEDKNPYPPDALDELRYRLGVNHALIGNSKEAKDYLTLIVNTPTIPNSQWVQPAREFLESYKLPEDIYAACINSRDCNPSYALEYLIENFDPMNLEDAVKTLSDLGVNITSSSYFDFDGDKQEERWITVKHRPTAQLEYWILTNSLEGGKAVYVGTVEANPPITELLDEGFVSEDADGSENVNFVDKKHAFVMKRFPGSFEPYIEFVPLRAEYPSHFQNGLDKAEEFLFEKDDPQTARTELLNLQDWPGLHCEVTWSCDRYYYMLGLASELSGYDREAIDIYLKLWRLYPESPFTTMGRVKLAGPGMQPTLIPVNTATSVPTVSVTAMPTGTVSPTAVNTPTVTLTNTVTPTITYTAEPGG